MLRDEGGLTLSVPGQPASKQTFLRPPPPPTCAHAVFPSVPILRANRVARPLGVLHLSCSSGSLPETSVRALRRLGGGVLLGAVG